MPKYLITISCQQKLQYVSEYDLYQVLLWLPPSLLVLHYSYETSGKYGQLHYHAVVEYNGLWNPYTQYGDSSYCLSFRIQWKRITKLEGAIKYVYKDTHNDPIIQNDIIIGNEFKHKYFNPESGEFELLQA